MPKPPDVNHLVRCYDNGGPPKGSIDRYTVCYRAYRAFFGAGIRRQSVWPYVSMSASPFHPQGIGQHGESQDGPIDRPRHRHLGKRIRFEELPEDCQKVVLRDLGVSK